MSEWIDVNESLPDCDFGYFLVAKRYHSDVSPVHVTMSFYIKNRDMARKELPYYSRKTQGKNSVHFSEASAGIVITHWMPLPAPPEK